jgi:FtsZ-interacting cell division protein ZipA
MVVLVIVLAVVAVAAIVLAMVTRSRLGAQRTLTASAATRATDAEAEAAAARADADRIDAARQEAEARAAEAAARNGLDPELLWTLEQARSERTWRQSVAVGPESTSVLAGAENPLREALQVELDAAREDVGAVVELDAELPVAVTPAGSVLVLRAAQELLARAVKTAEETTLVIRTHGDDVVVTVVAIDEDDQPVAIEPLAIPESADMEPADGGVRIRGAAAPLASPP